MLRIVKAQAVSMLLTLGALGCASGPAVAAVRFEGQVQAGGVPLANSTVSLWATSAAEPRQLTQANTGGDGRFQISSEASIDPDATLYLIAKGGDAVGKRSGNNPAIAFLSVLGNTQTGTVVINEMTTVASYKKTDASSGVMTLYDAPSQTMFFTDRPNRIVGNVPTNAFVTKWTCLGPV
jgi:hypothetical protein